MMEEDVYKKYSSHTIEELLQDNRFITSVTFPTEESDAYWSKALEDGTIDRPDYELAGHFIRSVQVRPERIRRSEIDNLWENIEIANKENLRRRKNRFRFYFSTISAIAVSFVFLYLLNALTQHEPAGPHASGIENIKAPNVRTTDIQLVLAGEETLSLAGEEARIVYHEEGIDINNRETDLKNRQPHTGRAVFNQLIVPPGKRSMLTFAEGTRLWVNAGTRVVYPAAFDRRQREIYVDGEVYLEVSPTAACPFVVKTDRLNVEVLGTSFNVMAYRNDTVHNIVLVSGAVKIQPGTEQEVTLSPNEMYLYANGTPEVRSVDVENYITWRSGAYRYESESLDVILKRLSRYYGREITYSPQVASLRCSGKLHLKDDLRLVLNSISHTAPIICHYDGERYMITNK
ncbi:MAG: FecR domain-containing protein [Tannerellaceae bacterium]|jgi:hypothetical protein|nr:FecR domain-containing protein [Tannerellaceae bacterium]